MTQHGKLKSHSEILAISVGFELKRMWGFRNTNHVLATEHAHCGGCSVMSVFTLCGHVGALCVECG